MIDPSKIASFRNNPQDFFGMFRRIICWTWFGCITWWPKNDNCHGNGALPKYSFPLSMWIGLSLFSLGRYPFSSQISQHWSCWSVFYECDSDEFVQIFHRFRWQKTVGTGSIRLEVVDQNTSSVSPSSDSSPTFRKEKLLGAPTASSAWIASCTWIMCGEIPDSYSSPSGKVNWRSGWPRRYRQDGRWRNDC